jgi:hypothetical protein
VKKKMSVKRPAYKKSATHPMKALPKVMAHAKGPKKAGGAKKALSGKVSSNFKEHIPVKGKKGGKTKETPQENPFGHGEVIKSGFV